MANELEYRIVVDTRQGTAAIRRVGRTYEDVGKKGAKGIKDTEKEATTLNRTLGRIQRTASAFIALMIGREIAQQFKRMVSAGIEFNATIEQSRLGIASIIMSQGKFTDSVGRTLDGYESLQAALEMSGELVVQLQKDNLRTIATLEQLVTAFQQGLAPAMERGFDVERAREFTVAMVQAAGALGLNLNMMAEELRSLLRGTITPRATFIATALGITNEDIRRYQSDVDGLFGFLMEKLESFQTAGIESQKTWKGLASNVADVIKFALGRGFEPLFEYLKREMADLQRWVVSFDEVTGEWEINPDLLAAFDSIARSIKSMVEGGKKFLGFMQEMAPYASFLYHLWELQHVAQKKAITGEGDLLEKLKEYDRWLTRKVFGGTGELKDVIKRATGALKEYIAEMKGVDLAQEGMTKAVREFWNLEAKWWKQRALFQQRGMKLTDDQKDQLASLRAELGIVTELEMERIAPALEYLGVIQSEKEAQQYVNRLTKEQLSILIKRTREMQKATLPEAEALIAKRAWKELVIITKGYTAEIAAAAAEAAELNKNYEIQDKMLRKVFETRLKIRELEKGVPRDLKEVLDELDKQQKEARERNRELERLDLSKNIWELREQYAEATGDIEDQRDAIVRLLELEIQRAKVLKTHSAEWEKMVREVGKLNELSREFERAISIEKLRYDLAEVNNEWNAMFEAEQKLLHIELLRALAVEGLSEKEQELAIAIYRRRAAQLQAAKDMNVAILFNIGMEERLLELQHELVDMYQNAIPNAIGYMANSLAGLWTDFITGSKSAKEALEDFVKDMARMLVRLAMQITLLIIQMRVLQALGYGGTVGVGGTQGGEVTWAGPNPEPWLQKGGVFTKPMRAVIADKGPEAVVPLEGGRFIPVRSVDGRGKSTVPNVNINIVNESGTPLDVKEAGISWELEELVVNLCVKNIESNGQLRTSILGVK